MVQIYKKYRYKKIFYSNNNEQIIKKIIKKIKGAVKNYIIRALSSVYDSSINFSKIQTFLSSFYEKYIKIDSF